jgi:transcription elongation factor Elf1
MMIMGFCWADLSKPIDIYCEWIDECEKANGEGEDDEGKDGGGDEEVDGFVA